MSDVADIIDKLARRIEAVAADELPTTYRRFLYQEHRGLSDTDAPALEIYPQDATTALVATDGTVELTPTVVVNWHERAAYGAETGDRRADERVAKAGLRRAQAVLEALLSFDGVVALDDGAYRTLETGRVEWGLTEGLTWVATTEVDVGWLQ